MKKIFSVVLTAAMILSMSVNSFAMSFTDTENHANQEAIDVLSELEIITGYNNDYFGPNDNLTRAQMTTMLVKAVYPNEDIHYNDNNFVDVPLNHWARAYIDTGIRHGIVGGYGDGYFGPEDGVTYTQAARMILNVLGYGDLSWPTGVNRVAYELGLYDNMNVANFNSICTRAHAAQMIYNTFNCNLVREYAGQYFVTKDTFLEDLLGYKETTYQYTEGKNAGHIFLAYNPVKTDDTIVTNTKLTYEDTIYINSDATQFGYTSNKLNNKISWNSVYLFIDNVKVSDSTRIKNKEVIGVFDSDDNLIAIKYSTPAKMSVPSKINNRLGTITRDANYNDKYSVVSFYDDENYTITNKYVADYIETVKDRNGYTVYELSINDNVTVYDDDLIGTNKDNSLEIGTYVIFHFDANDDIVDYTIVA